MIFWQDNLRALYQGNAQNMSELSDESVQCVVTSPPYWGLRKYAGQQELVWGGRPDCKHEWLIEKIVAETFARDGHNPDYRIEQPLRSTRPEHWQKVTHERGFCSLCGAWRGAYSLEPTPELYVQHTIEILREIRRVLRKDGVVFWNIGDSYNSKETSDGHSFRRDRAKVLSGITRGKRIKRGSGRWGGGNNTVAGLKPKDLCLIPFRVAIAAQDDGWWVRSVIIWNKSNPMPESVRDRPTDSHEYILLFAKSAQYYWDQEAVRELQTGNAHSRGTEVCNEIYQAARDSYKSFRSPVLELPAGRNLRSVWTFPTQPYPGAHFATFPEALPERCIKVATPEAGCCTECGAPWVRVIHKRNSSPREVVSPHAAPPGQRAHSSYTHERYDNPPMVKNLGWKASCKCNTDKPPLPSIVLDCFTGAGTTLKVAAKLGRRAIGYEISEEYLRLAIERNRQAVLVSV